MLQKNEEGHEQPIVLSSKILQNFELNYDINEIQDYTLVKIIKSFRPYLVSVELIEYVSYDVVKDIYR